MNKYCILLIAFIAGCQNSKSELANTPIEHKYKNVADSNRSKIDNLAIFNDLTKMLKNNENAFSVYAYPNVDTSQSKIIIDTMPFNNAENKAFILFATKYLDLDYYRKENTKPVIKIQFDGHGVLAYRADNQWQYKFHFIKISNYSKVGDCFKRLREIYFHEIAPMQEKGYNLYNIDDERMWNEPIWTLPQWYLPR